MSTRHPCKYCQSIAVIGYFMPKKFARIWLEVTAVMAHKVQDVSVEECIAEGLASRLIEHDACVDLKEQYQHLWDLANGKIKPGHRLFTLDNDSRRHFVKGQAGEYSWVNNPWCWAYTFNRIVR